MAKRPETSYELGGYTILGDVRAGVVDSIGLAAGWNEVSNFMSDLKYAVETGGSIESWMLGSGLSLRMADGTSTTPALAWGSPTWAEGIYRIAQGTLGLSMDFVPSAAKKDLGTAALPWDAFLSALDVASVASLSVLNVTGTATFNSAVNIVAWLNVGSADQAVAIGDFSAGKPGTEYRMFYDQSAGQMYIYDTAGNAGITLAPDGESVFNGQQGSTANFGIRGDNVNRALAVDVSEDEAYVDGRWSTRALTASTLVASSNNNYTAESVAANRSTWWRIQAASLATITGILYGYDGRHLYLSNVGSMNIALANANASSDASTRITTGTGGDVVLVPDDNAVLMYDAVASVWRQFV